MQLHKWFHVFASYLRDFPLVLALVLKRFNVFLLQDATYLADSINQKCTKSPGEKIIQFCTDTGK